MTDYKAIREQVKEFIDTKKQIPVSFYHGGDREIIKTVYEAVADYGTLSEDEQIVFDKIREVDFKGDHRIWYQGAWRSMDGMSDKAVRGAKMFMAHGYIEQKKGSG